MKITREDFHLIKQVGVEHYKNLSDDEKEQIKECNEYEELMLPRCSKCGCISDELEERTSMGIYAGRYCSEECWQNSGYRDVGPEEFDPTYAGERLEPEEDIPMY